MQIIELISDTLLLCDWEGTQGTQVFSVKTMTMSAGFLA